MSYPAIDIPFGPFMLAQNAQTQGAFINHCRFGGRPPFDEMDHINKHIDAWRQMRPALFLRPFSLSFDADTRTQMWSVILK